MNPIVCMIVDRCHVADSDLRVIRYVLSRLARKRKTFLAMPRRSRRILLRSIVRAHEANRALYRAVMGGMR